MKKVILLVGVLLLVKTAFAADGDLPGTLAELNHWYAEPPAGSNAATKFLEGFAALKITDADWNSANLPVIGKGKLPQPDKTVPSKMEAAMVGFVQRNQLVFPLLHQGAQLQQSRYPINLNRGWTTLLPHLAKIKTVAQLLEVSSISHAVAGQGKEAGDDLLTSLALARSSESEPVLVSQLVRVACNNIAVRGLEQVFNRVVLPAKTLDQLEQSLQQSEEREVAGFGFTRAFVGERLNGLVFFDMPPERLLKTPNGAMPEASENLNPEDSQSEKAFVDQIKTLRKKPSSEIKEIISADRQLYEATFDQAMAIRTNLFPKRLSQNEVFSRAEAVATNKNLLLSTLFLPVLKIVASKEAGCLANLRLAQTAVGLEKFRFAHTNRYPESLSELTPNCLTAVPADPFDGKGLRYRKAGNGYVLYSIGQNLKDDGGKSRKVQDGDIVFAVVNPPPPSRP